MFKTRWLLSFLLVLILSILLPSSSLAAVKRLSALYVLCGTEEPDARDRVDAWYSLSGTCVFFLPGHYRVNETRLYFEGVDILVIGGREYHSGDAFTLPFDQEMKVSGKGITTFSLTAYQSANIPAVYINTETGGTAQIHKSKTVREPGDMYMVDPAGNVFYDGKLKYIRTRGNSTFQYPKKPYQIKLDQKASLCGMSEDSTYILLANYLDRSEIRNTLALDLARYSGAYAFTPACQSVDLYLNGLYAGCYLLSEKCEIGNGRLNIANLEKALEEANDQPLESYPFTGNKNYRAGARRSYMIPNEPEDMSGGYLILANNTEYFQNEASGFVTNRGQAFTIQQPKYCSTFEIEYISGVMQRIENALFASDGRDPASGLHYTEMLDMTSFVNRYLQSELLNDFDGQRPLFYKDSDTINNMVYCGPVWDQDNILGASARRTGANYLCLDADQKRSYYWFTQAAKQPDFRRMMIRNYYEVYRPASQILLGEAEDPSGILRSIDEYAEEIRQSEKMDHVRWSRVTWNRESGGNLHSGNTLDECTAFLKDFIRTRIKTLDKAYPEQ